MLRSPRVQSRQRLKRRRKPRAEPAHRLLRRDCMGSPYKDRLGEWQKKTAWHRVQVWGDLAETVSANLRQGARVYVEGKLIIRNWIDKQNQKRRSTEVVASDVRFLTLAPSNGAQSGSELADEHAGD